jgi:hypothetical protein
VHILAPVGEDFYPELGANDNSVGLRVIMANTRSYGREASTKHAADGNDNKAY